MTREFWDNTWRDRDLFLLEPSVFLRSAEPSERCLLQKAGEVDGRRVLDLGCGSGLLSVYFAKMGARVTAIDTSSEAISKTAALAEYNDVDSRVQTLLLDANRLRELGEKFDLVVGRFILHHIEPFDEFSRALYDTISGDGRGVFLENNARNPVLMFIRRFIVGRFGIPKYGDDEETPFDPGEIETLRRSFESVNVCYPEFMFLQLAGSYVFKQKKGIMETLLKADDLIYRHVPVLHKYSYRQIVEVSHRA